MNLEFCYCLLMVCGLQNSRTDPIDVKSNDVKLGVRVCFVLLLISLFFLVVEFQAIRANVVIEGVSVNRLGVILKEPVVNRDVVVVSFEPGETYITSPVGNHEQAKELKVKGGLKPGVSVKYDLCKVGDWEVVTNIRTGDDVYFPISELKRRVSSQRKSAMFLFFVSLVSAVLWVAGIVSGRRQLRG